jgi:hypothetical protein
MGERSGETADHGNKSTFWANNVTFQQDNARPHVARVVRDYLTQQNVDLLPWSAVSPDLSPIKHVWDEMERQLNNFIPIAHTGQISGDNNQWCSVMCCYASPHHNTAPTKRLTLNDTGDCIFPDITSHCKKHPRITTGQL